MREAPPPSNWHTRALKWLGVVTALISLVLGGRQLVSWIGDVYGRQREAATLVEVARQQASRGEFATAWTSLERANEVRPGDAVDAARIDIAFAWLEDARPGPGQRFAVITDPVTPALDRALVSAQGERRADLLAHLGWVTFLRLRDGSEGDPAARYQEALSIDPDNVFANAMLGHWLMWRGAQIGPARERFDAALAAAGDRHPFVRRLQLASLTNRGETADAELLRVVNDMRTRGETLDPGVADYVHWIYTLRYGPNIPRARRADIAVSPADLAATYEWVFGASPSAQRSGQSADVRSALRDSRLRERARARSCEPYRSRRLASQRLANQGLVSPSFTTPVDVVSWLGAVQAQDYYGAKWAVGQRMREATDDAIEAAFTEGAILRTHVLRPTWHFVAPADIRWMLRLTAPRVNTTIGSYYRKLGLDDTVFRRTNKALTRALRGGRQLTRDALRQAVDRAGVVADGVRFGFILLRAELDGVICSGPREGKQFTYALLDERVPEARALTRDEALAELTRRYFTSRGPATVRDFVWWSGLTASGREGRRGDGSSAPSPGRDRWQDLLARRVADAAAARGANGVPAAALRRVPPRLQRSQCVDRPRAPPLGLAHRRRIHLATRDRQPRRRRLATHVHEGHRGGHRPPVQAADDGAANEPSPPPHAATGRSSA